MGLWRYDATPVDGGTRRTATLTCLAPLYLDGRLASVRLAFRDDPVWGYDVSLLLESGDFDCPLGCNVAIALDGGAPRAVSASRPESDAPMLSIREPRELWYALRDVTLLAIDFPTRGKGIQRATFDVGGLDRSWLDWDGQRHAKTRTTGDVAEKM